MRLSHIEIENFKGIGTKQSIELAPITLLFGPNSAGKSTILQALHYFREILERNNPDPDQTIAGGLTDLGGFATLVHNNDLTQPIRISMGIDLSDDGGNERLPLNSGTGLLEPQFESLPVRYIIGENTELRDFAVIQEISLSVEVRYSDLIGAPYISSVRIGLDGEHLAAMHSRAEQGLAELTDFNWAHPLLSRYRDPDEEFEDEEKNAALNSMSEVSEEDTAWRSPLGNELFELSRKIVADTQKNQGVRFRVGVETQFGALPELDDQLRLDLVEVEPRLRNLRNSLAHGGYRPNEDFSVFEEYRREEARRQGLTALLDEMILGSVRVVRDYLSTMTYIGPLREIPGRSYKPRLSPDESRWAQGLAAWDILYTQPTGDLLESVNAWMSSSERLQTGYRLSKIQSKQIPTSSGFHQLFQRGIEEDDLGDLQELYVSMPTSTEIGLLDVNRGTMVSPSDVGVGISQMVPVVVACLMEPKGLVAIEQPELHIHPAIQVGLGDLFIGATQGPQPAIGAERTVLIETHSEHLMLRLLRRVRENNDNELPPGVRGITSTDLSVIYVDNDAQGTQFKKLRVSEDGDFLDRWPRGFFDERAEELF